MEDRPESGKSNEVMEPGANEGKNIPATGLNWRLPLYGAIGFGIGFAITGAIMLTIYNVAQNAFSGVSGTGVGPQVGLLRGLVVGMFGGIALGMGTRNRSASLGFALAGITGFGLAFALVIAFYDAFTKFGWDVVDLIGYSAWIRGVEVDFAHGIGQGLIIGGIGGLAVGLASPKGRLMASLLLAVTGAIWFAIAFSLGNILFDGRFYSSWNAWGGGIGGAVYGLTLAVYYQRLERRRSGGLVEQNEAENPSQDTQAGSPVN